MTRSHLVVCYWAIMLLQACSSPGQIAARYIGYSPEHVPPGPNTIQQLKIPDGFKISVFAKGLNKSRMMAVDNEGTVYVTIQDLGHVVSLRDSDNDGYAEQVQTIFKLPRVHGIYIHGSTMYLAGDTQIWTAQKTALGFTGPKIIIDDLPKPGRHPNRTLAIGPDGRLYITVGSDCDACREDSDELAAILVAAADGSLRRVFARGLRNTIGFDFEPNTSQMWGMDNGSDGRGNDLPPEELNLLLDGKDYGWPYVYGNRVVDKLMGPLPRNIKMTKQEYAQTTLPSILDYQAHSAPIDFKFYKAAQFPSRYRGGAFVCFHGSWNRYPPVGYKVVFIRFENGKAVSFEDFVTGFLSEDGKKHYGRPAGLAVAKDGSLLFSDDFNGIIYRVSYPR